MPTQQFLVTTESGFEGYTITRYLGVVRGIGLRVITWSGAVGSVIGHNSNNPALYIGSSERGYWDATDQLIKQAMQMEANAIIGMRYDSNEVIPGVCQMLAYGTAVVIQLKLLLTGEPDSGLDSAEKRRNGCRGGQWPALMKRINSNHQRQC